MLKYASIVLVCALATAGLSVSAQEQPEKGPQNQPIMDDAASTDGVAETHPVSSDGSKESRAPSHVRFFTNLTDQGNATLGDAYRLAFILYHRRMGDADKGRARLAGDGYKMALIDAGLIGSDFGASDALATHQEAAYLFAQALGLKGGVFWSLSGSQRYAHREMKDRNLFPDENPRQYISGASVLSCFRDSTDYLTNLARE